MTETSLAYAKLWGMHADKEIEKYITTLPAKIGRVAISKSCITSPGFIDLGNDAKGISRHHATIDWVPEFKKFRITCFGKNGMTVAGKYWAANGEEYLSARTPIKLGPCCMYFILPNDLYIDKAISPTQNISVLTPGPSTPQYIRSIPIRTATGKTYVELTKEAFQSAELKDVVIEQGGLTSAEITGWAVARYPDVFSSLEPRRSLNTGVQGTLTRYGEKGPAVQGQKGARWTIREGGYSKRRKIDSTEGKVRKSLERRIDEDVSTVSQEIVVLGSDVGNEQIERGNSPMSTDTAACCNAAPDI